MSEYREKAITEYGEECHGCGSTEHVLIHHRDGDRSNNNLENLIPLCEACHGKVHARSSEFAELVEELGFKPRGTERTSIQVSEDLAGELYSKMERGESYEDVIWRLLGAYSEE